MSLTKYSHLIFFTLGIALCALGIFVVPATHAEGMLMIAVMVACLGLSVVTYRKLAHAHEHKAII